ncbi:glomulin, FKBP associated protein a [Phyllopteryx taeniolatus]|uniref:glomulin, FKBP associated protein a n=1 Tax=Phyllopteryx taeniolatus TaxID=161469 RepID=UPI002AD21B2D|nr:glomulin, FKBP associated protein a [Phyllopteryx taeniolatus]
MLFLFGTISTLIRDDTNRRRDRGAELQPGILHKLAWALFVPDCPVKTNGMALDQFSDVVQRCQALPADSYTPEDHKLFMTAGRSCIKEGNSAQVLSIVLDDTNQDMVRCMGWNLLAPLVQVLLQKEDKNLPHCLAIFNHLIETCRPKELLIGLLEQLEQEEPVIIAETLHLLLKPLQKVLLRLGSRKASSLGMALSSALEQVAKLPIPQTKEQEENDIFLLSRCCADLTDFVKPFIQEAKQELCISDCKLSATSEESAKLDWVLLGQEELRTELLKFCMSSLNHPLLEVQLDGPDTLASPCPLRDFATEILNNLNAIGESTPGLVYQALSKRKKATGFLEEEVRYPKESLASLAHLVFVHHLAADTFPCVFNPVFCLRCNMDHVNILLSRSEEFRIQKGLELYENCLFRVEDNSLPSELLEIKTFLTVPQNLTKVMTICPRHDLRSKALKVFQLSIEKFNLEAKYNFFKFMLKMSNHSGVEGYIIKNIRSQIDVALRPGNSNIWFEGVHLLPLLRFVFTLQDGPETDLLQYLDRVMESLNLLRYLVIRDKVTENRTGIWTELQKIEGVFMKPLRIGLNMSRAHYERELSTTLEKNKRNVKETSVISVSVGDEKLPNMTSESQIQALHSALHTFDMMESVLVRIEELTEVKGSI